MIPIIVLIVLLILSPADGRYCKSNTFFLFTGFKVHRQYIVSGYLPTSHQFLVLSHCDHGKLDYQKVIKVKSINRIDWDSPICLIKPSTKKALKGNPEDTVKSLENHQTRALNESEVNKLFGRKGGGPKTSKIIKRMEMVHKIGKLKQAVKAKVKNWIEQNIPMKSPIQYTSPPTNNHIYDSKNSTLQTTMEWESSNLVCYKLARRKKYAKRDISFYIPKTFVGGFFECLIPQDLKSSYFQNFTVNQTISDIKFECDEALSIPLSPLIGDYSGKQWWEVKKNIFNPTIIQTIPFLTTASPLNLRFSLTETPDMYKDTWASNLKVNEDYYFNDLDLHLITRALASTSDYIFKLLEPINFGTILNNIPEVPEDEFNGKHIIYNDFIIDIIKRFSIDQKLGILLSIEPKRYLRKLTNLQKIWDDLLPL